MSDNDFNTLRIGDEVNVVAFTLHSKQVITAKVVGKSFSKIQVEYQNGRVAWKSKKVVMMKGDR